MRAVVRSKDGSKASICRMKAKGDPVSLSFRFCSIDLELVSSVAEQTSLFRLVDLLTL